MEQKLVGCVSLPAPVAVCDNNSSSKDRANVEMIFSLLVIELLLLCSFEVLALILTSYYLLF